MNIYLFGDSVIDNSPYVGTQNCVSTVLQKELLEVFTEAQVTNYAHDGYTTPDVLTQLEDLKVDSASYIVLSIGGNDLLSATYTLLGEDSLDSLEEMCENIFSNTSRIKQQVLEDSKDIGSREKIFGCILLNYELIYQNLLKIAPKIILLNLYYPEFNAYGASFAQKAPTVINTFNSILDETYCSDSIIYLSDLMIQKENFTNVIEPSISGTKIITKAIKSEIMKLENNDSHLE